MGSKNSSNPKPLGVIIFIIAIFTVTIACAIHDKKHYNKDRYDVKIMNKYSDLDNHFLSGTSTRYVVYAEIRQTYSSTGNKLQYYRKEYEIDGTSYNMAIIGKTYISKKDIRWDSDMNNLLK